MEKDIVNKIKDNIASIKSNADDILSNINSYKIDKLSGEIKDNEVVFYGIFKNKDNTTSKFRTDTTVKNLLDLDSKIVADLLSAFGNYDRFRIIRLLLDNSRTPNEIVDILGLPTTGKAYHHLNALVATGLIFKYSDGRYYFHAKYIQTVMALLVGCNSYINKNKND